MTPTDDPSTAPDDQPLDLSDLGPSEDRRRNRLLWILGAALAVVILAILLWPQAREGLAPRLVAAHVAIEPAGAGRAVVGPVDLAAGQGFTLHAVLEAERRDGTALYYTEAPGLEVEGTVIAADNLLPWAERASPSAVRIFWFTVEGVAPFVPLESEEQLERLRYTEYARPDWPLTWSIPGRLEPRFDDGLAEEDGVTLERPSFGTMRYQVRIERFDDDESLVADERWASPGGERLPEAVASFPTVRAALDGAAGPASLAFGLPQLEPREEASATLRARLVELTEAGLAFSRTALLRRILQAADTGLEELAWSEVDLSAGPAWGPDGSVGRGDLLRVGGRVVVLYEDRGEPGRLDRDDLCFDYERGAMVTPLGRVFVGEGLVEHAALPGPADG